MSDDKVFITPEDWGLPDCERMTARRDDSEPGYTDDWFFIERDGEIVFRMHEDEIRRLFAFTRGTLESDEKPPWYCEIEEASDAN